jgi:hypothetical protein
MQSKRIPDVAATEAASESAIMLFLLQDQPVWSAAELATVMGDPVEAEDCLTRLQASGLVHRWGDYCCATRAAHYQYALDQQ